MMRSPTGWQRLDVSSVVCPVLTVMVLVAAGCGGDPEPVDGDKVGAETDTGLDVGTVDTAQADTGPTSIDAGTAPECTKAADCDQPGTACMKADCVSGKCVLGPSQTACDDGDPCTQNDRCVAGSCVGVSAGCDCKSTKDCAGFEDGNLCNGTLFCDLAQVPHKCRVKPSTVVVCKLNPGSSGAEALCAGSVCAPQTGKCETVHKADGTPCVDADACTVDSSCKAGKCVGGAESWCQCKTSKDCAVYDDKDLCNGSLYCDKSVFPPRCKLNAASVVACSSNADTACSNNTCDPNTGKCVVVAAKDGADCDPNSSCKNEGTCKKGSDGVSTCTADLSVCACEKNIDCLDQEDGDFCNGTLYCDKSGTGNKGVCKPNPATTITCATVTDTQCAKNKCVPTTGACVLQPANENSGCDDANTCTKGETCKVGKCKGGTDVCKCKADSDCVAKDDGNLCNGTLFCNAATKLCELNPSTIKSCPSVDDSDCKKNACDPKTGTCSAIRADHVFAVKYADGAIYNEVKPAAAATKTVVSCDDGNACTAGDLCAATVCKPGKDTCSCSQDADCAKQEDGNACNGTLFCNNVAGKCVLNPKTVVTCKTTDDTACLTRACQPATGQCLLTPRAFGTACQDGNACTTGDYCNKDGQCLGGKKVCACQSAADCTSHDDGDDCNGVVFCDKSSKDFKQWKCIVNNPATKVFCNPKDDTACLANSCAAGKCALKPRPDGTGCDDGTVCSKKSACKTGKCTGSDQLVCNDNNACTLDTCDPKNGCVFAPKKDHCKDANACTVAACDPKTGNCTFDKKKRHGNACDADKDGCTVGDVCDNGTCKSGALVKCNVSTKACLASKCQSKDSNNFQCVTTIAADGSACQGNGGSCSLGGACKAGQCVQGALKKLWSRVIDPAPHMHMQANAVAADGDRWLVAMARVQKKTPTANIKAWWRFTSYDKSGKQLTSVEKQLPADAGDVAGLVPAVGGGFWAIGSAGGGKNAMWHVKDGVVGTIKPLPAAVSGVKEWATGVASYGSGDIAVVGNAPGFKGAQTPIFKRVTQSGIVLGNSAMKSQKFKAEAVAIAENGVAFVVGAKDGPSLGTQRGVVRVDKKFAFTADRGVGVEGADASFYDVAAVAGGVVAAGVGYDKTSGTFGAVAKIDLAGNTLWDRSLGNGVVVRAFARRAGSGGDGWFLVGSKKGQATGQDAWFGSVDVDFNLHKEAVTYRAGDDGLRTLLALKDGVFSAGYVGVNSGTAWFHHGLVTRMDAWGNTTCSGAGKCADVSAKDCDDGKPCTRDACISISGSCAHISADGFVCSGGGCAEKAACEKGACVPKGNERLWQRAVVSVHNLKYGFDIAPRPDGSAALLVYEDGSIFNWTRLLNLDRFGQPSNNEALDPDVRGLASASNGDTIVCRRFWGKQWGGEFWGLQRLRLANGKYTTVWTAKFASPKSTRMRGLHAYVMSDGTFAGLGARQPNIGQRRIAWARVHSNGATIFERHLAVPPGQTDWPYAAAVLPDTSVIIAGSTNDGEQRGLAIGLTHTGAQSWRRKLATVGQFHSAIHVPGGAVLGGWAGDKNKPTAVLTKLTSDGKVRWQKKPSLAGRGHVASLVRNGNEVTALLAEVVGFKSFASLRGFNSAGVQQWSRTLENGPFLNPRSIKKGPDGSLWLAGDSGDPNKPTPYIAKLSPWGDRSCTEAGKCFSTTATKCDDGDACTANTCDGQKGCGFTKTGCDDANACTIDACEKKAGCTHKATAALCDDGDQCTEKDACAGGFCVGKARNCDDGNPCTDDSCDGSKGCVAKSKKDGTTCPVSNGCSLSAACKAGVCAHSEKGKLWATDHDLYKTTKPSQVFINIASTKGGWVGIFSQRPFGYAFNLMGGRIDSAGGFKLAGNLGGGTYQKAVDSSLTLPVASGGFLLTWGEGGADRVLRARLVDDKLKAIGLVASYPLSASVVGKYPRTYPRAISRLADGSIAIAGDLWGSSGGPRMDVQLIQADLKSVWRRQFPGNAASVYTRAAVATSDGGFIAGGWQKGAKLSEAALLQKVSKSGTSVFRRVHHSAGATAIERLVRDGSDLMAAGRFVVGKKTSPWLARFDDEGKKLWSRVVPQPSSAGLSLLAKRADGGYLLAGNRTIGLGTAIWLQHVDSLGNPTWRRDLQHGSSHWMSREGAIALADGGLLLGGGTIVNGNARGVVIRTDAWGNIACKDGGVCPSKAPGASIPKGCDDAKTCTADRCDPAKGCVHTARSCDDANPCTTDSCDATKGCQHKAASGPCNDGSICTIGESCQAGACASAKVLDCDDANACTQDACHPVSGCENVALDSGTCDDGSKCSEKTVCAKGVCMYSGPALLRAVAYDNSTDSNKYPVVSAGIAYKGSVIYAMPRRFYHWKWKKTDNYELRWGRMGPRGKYYHLVSNQPRWTEGKALFTSQLSLGGDQNQGVVAARSFRHVSGSKFVALRRDRNHWRYRDRIRIEFLDADLFKHSRQGRTIDPPYDASALKYTHHYYGDDIRVVIDGSFAIAGFRSTAATGRIELLYIRTDGTGLPKYTRASGRNDGDDYGHALVTFKTGHAVIAGATRKSKGPMDPLLTRFDNAGKLVWRKSSAVSGKSVTYERIESSGGQLITAGRYIVGTDKRYVIAAHGEDGALKWRKHPKLATPVDFRGLGVSPDGSFLVAGDRDDGIVKKAWLTRLDAAGKPVWYREYQVGKTTMLGRQGLVVMDDGGAALLGGTVAFSRENPAIIRVDAWGNAGCQAAGQCRTTVFNDCAKKCAGKLAMCDAKKGCVCK